MATLEKIEGIGAKQSKQLAQSGIKTTEALLKKAADPKGRKEIEKESGIGHKLIMKWVNKADLFRVKGIGEEYSDLLETAGVDTVVELSKRRPDNLYKKILEINNEKKLVRQTPSEEMIAGWIESAKGLPRVITY